jgi:hypothetical protein
MSFRVHASHRIGCGGRITHLAQDDWASFDGGVALLFTGPCRTHKGHSPPNRYHMVELDFEGRAPLSAGSRRNRSAPGLRGALAAGAETEAAMFVGGWESNVIRGQGCHRRASGF